jgi:uncharacterized membrane protein
MRASTVILIILLASSTFAATIRGSVYDFSLEPAKAIVRVDTSPSQQVVARSYEFDVPPGTYTLTARRVQDNAVETANETVTITDNGTYIRDLILFPEVDVNRSMELNDTSVDPDDFNYWEPIDRTLQILAILSIIAVLWGLHFSHKKRMEAHEEEQWEIEDLELDEDARKIFEFVDEEKRTTQKRIREEFSFSQSKISLILTDLEDKGLIRKVKRGRGNVILRN